MMKEGTKMLKRIGMILTGGIFVIVIVGSGIGASNVFAKSKSFSTDVVSSATEGVGVASVTSPTAITTPSGIVITHVPSNSRGKGAIKSAKGKARAAEVKKRNDERKKLKDEQKMLKKKAKSENEDKSSGSEEGKGKFKIKDKNDDNNYDEGNDD
jgi:hypothetical protein